MVNLVICMIKMSVCVLCTGWWGGVSHWVYLYIVLSLSIEMGERRESVFVNLLYYSLRLLFFWLLNYYSLRFGLSKYVPIIGIITIFVVVNKLIKT